MDPVTLTVVLIVGITVGNVLAYFTTAVFTALQYRRHFKRQQSVQNTSVDELMEAFRAQYIQDEEHDDRPRAATRTAE